MFVPVDPIMGTKHVFVDIWLGNFCNYSCDYCFLGSNEGTIPASSFEELEPIIREITKRYSFKKFRYYNLLGGEPTLVPHLKDIVSMIKSIDPDCIISMTTNGSRTIRYWKDIAKYIDEIVISIHPKDADPEHIAQVVEIIQECGTGVVNLMLILDPTRWDRVLEIGNYLIKRLPNQHISPKILKDPNKKSFGPIVYTEEHDKFKEKLLTRQPNTVGSDILRHKLYEKFYRGDNYDNLESIKHVRLSDEECTWTGIYCLTGIDNLILVPAEEADGYDGTGIAAIAGSACRQIFISKKDLPPSEWDWPSEPVICKWRKPCRCGPDQHARKFVKWDPENDPVQAQIQFPGKYKNED